jgi:hypothetical protein
MNDAFPLEYFGPGIPVCPSCHEGFVSVKECDEHVESCPAVREERAARAAMIGADELQNRLEWKYRNNPEESRRARNFYRLFCAELEEQLRKVEA